VSDKADARTPRWSGLGPALEILGLWALAGAQPVLDLFGTNAEFFVASDAGPGEIVAFALLVALGVPLLLIALELLVRWLRPSWSTSLHGGILILLAVLFGLNLARQFGLETLIPALLVTLLVVAALVFLGRWPTAHQVLRYLGVAPIAFALLFVFSSDAGSLVFAEDAEVIDSTAGSDGPVAVVVFDELPLASLLTRDGEINERRFPNVARLAGMSTWYRNATSVHPSTPESVPAILSGSSTVPGQLPTSTDHPVNIFTLLGGTHEVSAFEGVTDLCPDDVCVAEDGAPGSGGFLSDVGSLLTDAAVVYGHLTLPEPVKDTLPTLGEGWAGFLDQGGGDSATPPVDVRDDVSDFLVGRLEEAQSRGGAGRDLAPLFEGYDAASGSLLVGHDPFMAHRPWHLTPEGHGYDGGTGGVSPGQEEWPDDPVYVRRVLQRHLLQVGYADALLGQLLDRFEEAGTLDDATIVVVADHGMSFEEGGRARSPNDDNVQEIYRVPLFIKAPGQAVGDGRASDVNALTVDIVPTVMDLLGVEVPSDVEVEGLSLAVGGEVRDAEKPVVYGSGPDSVPGGFDEVLVAARRNADLVNDGGWLSLLQVGPAGPLVGERVSTVPSDGSVAGTWTMDREEQLRDIGRGLARPVAVEGTIDVDLDGPLPTQVLIALDGILAGIGDLNTDTGEFAALLDEQRLTPGPHELDLYLPTADGAIQRIEGD